MKLYYNRIIMILTARYRSRGCYVFFYVQQTETLNNYCHAHVYHRTMSLAWQNKPGIWNTLNRIRPVLCNVCTVGSGAKTCQKSAKSDFFLGFLISDVQATVCIVTLRKSVRRIGLNRQKNPILAEFPVAIF